MKSLDQIRDNLASTCGFHAVESGDVTNFGRDCVEQAFKSGWDAREEHLQSAGSAEFDEKAAQKMFIGLNLQEFGLVEAMLFAARWQFNQMQAEIERLKAELEKEQVRLAGCGVAALLNTEKSIADRITTDNEYYSASYGDVCRAVDREMKLRSQLAKLTDALKFYADENNWDEDGEMILPNAQGFFLEYDKGKTARQALASINGGENE